MIKKNSTETKKKAGSPSGDQLPAEGQEAEPLEAEAGSRRSSRLARGVVSDELFLRSLSSFEAILVSHTEEKKHLATRINWVIRGGIIILGLIAVSILVLLLSLASQVRNISSVVKSMNQEFTSVQMQMEQIRGHVGSMQTRVALLEKIQVQTDVMNSEMALITGEMEAMAHSIDGVGKHVGSVRSNIDHISGAISQMNASVQGMGYDMYRIGQPAQSMNKMFPFP